MIVSIHCLILIYSLAPVSGGNSVLQQGPLVFSPLPLHQCRVKKRGRPASSSRPRRVIVSLSRPRRVNFTESSSSSHRLVESSSSSQPCLSESSSCSYGASSSHPRRVIESSSSPGVENRVVLVECWSTAWKFECLFIYFWASVERWLRSQKRRVIILWHKR